MRGPLPLTDRDFAEVRAGVLARLRRRRTYRFEWGLAFAALALVVLSFFVAQVPVPAPPAPHVIASAPPVIASVPSVIASVPSVIPSVPSVIPSVARDLGGGAERHPPAQVPRYARDDGGNARDDGGNARDDGGRNGGRKHRQPKRPQVARIEIHTADPNIRIIWIAN